MLAAQTPAPFPAGKLPAGWTQGIDVSSVNHPDGAPIGWAKVAAAGYRFAFVKATEGSYYANPYYLCLTAPAIASTTPLALSYCVTGFPRLTWHGS